MFFKIGALKKFANFTEIPLLTSLFNKVADHQVTSCTALKVSVFGVTPCLSIFSRNAGKCGPE